MCTETSRNNGAPRMWWKIVGNVNTERVNTVENNEGVNDMAYPFIGGHVVILHLANILPVGFDATTFILDLAQGTMIPV